MMPWRLTTIIPLLAEGAERLVLVAEQPIQAERATDRQEHTEETHSWHLLQSPKIESKTFPTP